MSQPPLSIADALRQAQLQQLPRLDAQMLLLHVLGQSPRDRAWLLAHDDEAYTHEKGHAGLNRITGALYEGVRGSEPPHLYDFRSIYFPGERDRR